MNEPMEPKTTKKSIPAQDVPPKTIGQDYFRLCERCGAVVDAEFCRRCGHRLCVSCGEK